MYSLINLQLMFKNDYKLAQFMSRARENQVYVGNRCIRIGERLYAEHIDEGIQLMDDALKIGDYCNSLELHSIQRHKDELEHIKELHGKRKEGINNTILFMEMDIIGIIALVGFLALACCSIACTMHCICRQST